MVGPRGTYPTIEFGLHGAVSRPWEATLARVASHTLGQIETSPEFGQARVGCSLPPPR
jgi:hypothetical protein